MSSRTTLCAKTVSADTGRLNNLLVQNDNDGSNSLLELRNNNGSASGPLLKFFKNPNEAANNDECGVIQFNGLNDASENIEFAQIVASSELHTNGDEEGKLELKVMSNGQAALVSGLSMEGTTTTGQVDVTLGAGSSSVVSVPGIVSVTSGVQSAAVARSSTVDGLGNGLIADGTSFVSVTSGNADHIVTLPSPTVGNIVYIHVGVNGCELRSSDPATISINGGNGVNAESALSANTLTICICVSTTAWFAFQVSNTGNLSALTAASP